MQLSVLFVDVVSWQILLVWKTHSNAAATNLNVQSIDPGLECLALARTPSSSPSVLPPAVPLSRQKPPSADLDSWTRGTWSHALL